MTSGAAGHRAVAHTADVRIEAWAPSREECLEQAVTALVDSFADVSRAGQTAVVDVPVGAGSDEDVLAGVLEEVIYRMDTAGQLPIGVRVDRRDGGLLVRFRMTGVDRAELVGAVPKAVSLGELRLARQPEGWSCHAIVDV